MLTSIRGATVVNYLTMKRVIVALALGPAGLTAVFGIGAEWRPSRLVTVASLYLTASLLFLVVLLRFEGKRLEREFQLRQQQYSIRQRLALRRNSRSTRHHDAVLFVQAKMPMLMMDSPLRAEHYERPNEASSNVVIPLRPEVARPHNIEERRFGRYRAVLGATVRRLTENTRLTASSKPPVESHVLEEVASGDG